MKHRTFGAFALSSSQIREFYDQPIGESAGAKVLEVCGIREGRIPGDFRVLDFGCGNGRYLDFFARYLDSSKLVGIETDDACVREVARKGFHCILLDITDACFPFRDCSFDVVFSSNVIEHIPRKAYLEYLGEISRVLKHGGRFVVGTPNYPVKRLYDMKKAVRTKFTSYYLFDDPTHCNKLSIFRLEKDLKKHFSKVYLAPSHIFFEQALRFLQRPRIRHLFRGLGDKVFGYCIKG